MLSKISLKFTDYLITKGKVAENRRKIYDYGFELLFSTIDDNTTKKITIIISHIAKVFIPFFKIIPPLYT